MTFQALKLPASKPGFLSFTESPIAVATAAAATTTTSPPSALRDRRDALVEALGEQLPEADFVVPEGGYFLWLTLAEDVDSVALLGAAAEEGVAFVAGPDFLLEGGANALRLSFASVPAERVAEGVGRIARALDGLRAGRAAA